MGTAAEKRLAKREQAARIGQMELGIRRAATRFDEQVATPKGQVILVSVVLVAGFLVGAFGGWLEHIL